MFTKDGWFFTEKKMRKVLDRLIEKHGEPAILREVHRSWFYSFEATWDGKEE
jgi:hypothetical protein